MYLYLVALLVLLFSPIHVKAKSATFKTDGNYAVITSLNFSKNEMALYPGNSQGKSEISIHEYKNAKDIWYSTPERRCTSRDDAYNLFKSYNGARIPRAPAGSGGTRDDYLLMLCVFKDSYFYISFYGAAGEIKPDPLPPPPRPSCVIGGYSDIVFSISQNDSAVKNSDSIVRCSSSADFKMTIIRLSYNFADGVYAYAVFDNMETTITYRNVLSVTNRVRVTAGSNSALASTSSTTYLVTLELL